MTISNLFSMAFGTALIAVFVAIFITHKAKEVRASKILQIVAWFMVAVTLFSAFPSAVREGLSISSLIILFLLGAGALVCGGMTLGKYLKNKDKPRYLARLETPRLVVDYSGDTIDYRLKGTIDGRAKTFFISKKCYTSLKNANISDDPYCLVELDPVNESVPLGIQSPRIPNVVF